jgi:hypothetical protein
LVKEKRDRERERERGKIVNGNREREGEEGRNKITVFRVCGFCFAKKPEHCIL